MAFTKREEAWVKRLQKTLDAVPKKLCLYVLDGDCIIICRDGESSHDTSDSVSTVINPGNVLTDIHDDFDFGRG